MKLSLVLLVLLLVFAGAEARAEPPCRVGEICELQTPLLGCADVGLLKRWIDLYVEENREAAEHFLADQIAAGRCQRFQTGDKLRLTRYLGLRRLEAQRPGDNRTFILLLK